MMTSIPLTTGAVLPQVARVALAGPGIPSDETRTPGLTKADGNEEAHTLYIPLHAMSREP